MQCPAGCSSYGYVWGTDVYTGFSCVCKAAIHAGVISGKYKNVLLFYRTQIPSYISKTSQLCGYEE